MRTKKVKPPPKRYEYILNISKEYDAVTKRDYISFRFQTTKEFLSFKYVLKIEFKAEEKNLYFNMLGFTAPIGDLSGSGTACYEYRMFDFKTAEYNVLIDKKDSDKSKFRLIIQRSKTQPIMLSHIPKNSFIEIMSENDS